MRGVSHGEYHLYPQKLVSRGQITLSRQLFRVFKNARRKPRPAMSPIGDAATILDHFFIKVPKFGATRLIVDYASQNFNKSWKLRSTHGVKVVIFGQNGVWGWV